MAIDLSQTAQAASVAASAATNSHGLSWTDIVALVGAGAWLPFIWRSLQKPKVTLFPGGQIEIGFTGLGPIFNPSIAFRTEKRDALITDVWFKVRHENGKQATFRCVQLTETGTTVQANNGQHAVHSRVQSVVALVLTPTSVPERKVQCQEVRHLADYDAVIIGFENAIRRTANPPNPYGIVQATQSSEAQALVDFWKREFFWQAGKYEVKGFAKINELKSPALCNFSFLLTDLQLQALQNNTSLLDWELKRIAGDPSIGVGSVAPWQWIYIQARK